MFAKAKTNYDGKLVIPQKFDAIVDEREGVYLVKRDNLFGLIDMQGNEIVSPKFRHIDVAKSDVFVVETLAGYQIYKNDKPVNDVVYNCRSLALKEAEKY